MKVRNNISIFRKNNSGTDIIIYIAFIIFIRINVTTDSIEFSVAETNLFLSLEKNTHDKNIVIEITSK